MCLFLFLLQCQLKRPQSSYATVSLKTHPARNLELEEVCCRLSLAGDATSIIFVATKPLSGRTRVCRDKSMLAATKLLSRHRSMFVATKYFCRDKTFVVRNFCRDKHVFVEADILLSIQKMKFVVTKVSLSRQNFCRDKHTFVSTKDVFDANDSRQPIVRFSSQNCCFR